MKQIAFIVKILLIVAALVAISVVLALLAKDATELPAWVQAVGSVAAIIAAYTLANSQAKANERQRVQDKFQEEADLCRTALLISVEAVDCLGSVTSALSRATRGVVGSIETERIEEVLIALRSLATKNLTFAIHANVLTIQGELAHTLAVVRQVNKDLSLDHTEAAAAQRRLAKVQGSRDVLIMLAKDQYKVPEMDLL
jgi:hypothetical protein